MKNATTLLLCIAIIFTAAGQTIEKGLYKNALLFQRQGDFDQAIKMLDKYIEINPYDHEAYLRRAMVYDEMGQNNLMMQDLETANYINPFGHLLYDQSQRKQFLEKRNFNYEWISQDDSSEIESFKKSPLTSHHYYNIVDGNQQSQEDSLLKLAIENIDLRYYDDALQILDEIQTNPITEKLVWDLKGIVEFKRGNLQNAIDYFTNAIQIDPSFAIAYHNRSLCYKQLRNFQAAKKDLETAIEINNNYAQFYFTKALLNEYMNEEGEALENYQKAINKDEYYAEAIFNYSVLLKKLGRYQEAVIELNKAIKVNPDKIENYFQRANINLIYGEYQNAIEDFEKYLDVESNDGLAYFNLGLAYSLLDDKDSACEAFTKSQDLGYKPKNEFIIYNCR